VTCSGKCGNEPPFSIKFGGNSSVDGDLLHFEQGLCSMELVSRFVGWLFGSLGGCLVI